MNTRNCRGDGRYDLSMPLRVHVNAARRGTRLAASRPCRDDARAEPPMSGYLRSRGRVADHGRGLVDPLGPLLVVCNVQREPSVPA